MRCRLADLQRRFARLRPTKERPPPPVQAISPTSLWSTYLTSFRGDRDYGLPEDTVDHLKRVRVRAAAYGLLDRGTLPNGRLVPRLPLRFDLIVLEPGGRIRHHRHAM